MEDYCDQLTSMIINLTPEYHTISTFKSQLCFFNAIGLNLTCPLWYCAEILEDSAALTFECWLMKLQWKMYRNCGFPSWPDYKSHNVDPAERYTINHIHFFTNIRRGPQLKLKTQSQTTNLSISKPMHQNKQTNSVYGRV